MTSQTSSFSPVRFDALRALGPILLLHLMVHPASATFSKETSGPVVQDGARSTAGAWHDWDQDGDQDLFVAVGNQTLEDNRLYRNDGVGFALITSTPISSDAASSIGGTWSDYDGDGDADLFVANRQGLDNLLYRNDGGGAFVQVTTGPPVSAGGNSNAASWIDLDGDADLDLFVINFNEANRHYRNDGGAFTEITSGSHVTDITFSISGVWADYDADGDPDLFVANGGSQNNMLYRNDGGTFPNVSATAGLANGAASIGASWGDIDNDGDLDLFVANTLGQNNFLYENDGAGGFVRILVGAVVTDGGNSTGSAFTDFDNDGDLDLFVGNDGTSNFLYVNDGSGAFTKVVTGSIVTDGGSTFGVSFCDWNGDGYQDAFAANRNGQNDGLYTNDGGSDHWLQVALTGSATNSTAVGAKVEVVATVSGVALRQFREISSQTGYNSANDPRASFGLGNAAIVDSVLVTWPGGTVAVWTDIAVDQVLAVTAAGAATGVHEAFRSRLAELTLRPNPSRGPALIQWNLPQTTSPTLRIVDVRGRAVRTLRGGFGSGRGSVQWDGRDQRAIPVSPGVYFVVLESDAGRVTGKLTVLK